VEDEFLIAMELNTVLTEAGFTVIGPVSTVVGALDRIRTDPPHAAVLDVSLRGERVTPVAEVLAQMGTPYVLTSAYQAAELAGEPSLERARNLGKPTSPTELVAALRDFHDSQL
jgi:two-component system, response regulator PdtaR